MYIIIIFFLNGMGLERPGHSLTHTVYVCMIRITCFFLLFFFFLNMFNHCQAKYYSSMIHATC